MKTIHGAQAGQGGLVNIACINKAKTPLGVDFDKLTAGDDDFSAFGQRVEREESSRGAIIDNDGGPRSLCGVVAFHSKRTQKELFGMNIAAAPFTGVEIEFKIGVACGSLDDVFERGGAERSSA